MLAHQRFSRPPLSTAQPAFRNFSLLRSSYVVATDRSEKPDDFFIVTAERICLSNSLTAELPRYNRIITYAGSQDKDFAEFTSLMIAAVFDRKLE